LVEKLNKGEVEKLSLNSIDVTLSKDDILVYPHSKPNFCAEEDYGFTVILDTVLSQELIDEGIMREIISKLQNLRKEAGYEVEDKIIVQYTGAKKVQEVIEKYKKAISDTILATEMSIGVNGDLIKDIEINEMPCKFGIRRVNN